MGFRRNIKVLNGIKARFADHFTIGSWHCKLLSNKKVIKVPSYKNITISIHVCRKIIVPF